MTTQYLSVEIKDHTPINVGIFHARITSDTLDDPTPRFYNGQLYFPNMVIRLLDNHLGFVRNLYLHVEANYNDHPLVKDFTISAPDVMGNWLCEQLLKKVDFVSEHGDTFHYIDGVHTLNGVPNADLSDYDLGVMGHPDLIEIAKGVYMCVNPVRTQEYIDDLLETNEQRCIMLLKYIESPSDDYTVTHSHHHNLYTIYDHLAITPSHMDSGVSADVDVVLFEGIRKATAKGIISGSDDTTFAHSFCNVFSHKRFIEPTVKRRD